MRHVATVVHLLNIPNVYIFIFLFQTITGLLCIRIYGYMLL